MATTATFSGYQYRFRDELRVRVRREMCYG